MFKLKNVSQKIKKWINQTNYEFKYMIKKCIYLKKIINVIFLFLAAVLMMRSLEILTPYFIADHPFLFFITDDTNAIQFMGHYSNPNM